MFKGLIDIFTYCISVKIQMGLPMGKQLGVYNIVLKSIMFSLSEQPMHLSTLVEYVIWKLSARN